MIDTVGPRILLLGGGYTLSRAAARLEGSTFTITTTSTEKAEAYRKLGYSAEILDLSDPESIASFAERQRTFDVVVDSVPPLAASIDLHLSALALLFDRVSCRKVLYLSTTGVSGVQDGSEVSESLHATPVTKAARNRRAVEGFYESRKELNATILRLPAIYGPGRGIGIALRDGRMKLIEDGSRWSNRIHVDDLVEVIVRSSDPAQKLPALLYISDDRPALQREVVQFYCDRFGFPYPESISIAEAETRGMHTLLSNQRVRNDLMKAVFHMNLKYPSFLEGAGTEFA